MLKGEQTSILIHRNEIIDQVNVIHIIDYFIEHNVINDEERKRIFEPGIKLIQSKGDFSYKREATMKAQTSSLLDILNNKEGAFVHLVNSLNHSYPELADKLVAQKKKLNSSQPFYKMLGQFVASHMKPTINF